MRTKTKNWHKKRVHHLVSSVVGIAMLAGGIVMWQLVPKSDQNEPARIVPGTFPKKIVKIESATDTPAQSEQVTKTDAQPTYPVLLSKEEANDLQVVVNKKHKLPSDYVPELASVRSGQLRPEAASALDTLLSAAESEGMSVKVISAYRSYAKQESVYGGYVSSSGQALADTFSARPGHSEHQTGLGVDVGTTSCDLLICFGNTAFGEWLKSNSYKYGFIIRYEEGKDAITGYQYEPWHLRFIGIDIATKVHESGKTLDEYYGVVAGSY